jgi:hypothetical protein
VSKPAGGWVATAAALVWRPSLWSTAIRQARRTARRGWWRRPPFLPVPGGDYLAFRAETQYGEKVHRLEPADVLNYLGWCRAMRFLEGRR